MVSELRLFPVDFFFQNKTCAVMGRCWFRNPNPNLSRKHLHSPYIIFFFQATVQNLF
ncbi:hypothetical protein HanRHA438_Chr04g0192311 [Helianthus annuus]|nr:hypothetical protein HanRHA438_Chr04g0192311 [Helianthus annuus]